MLMKTNVLLLALLIGVSIIPEWAHAQEPTLSVVSSQSAAPDPLATDAESNRIFPVARLDESLPEWLRFGGEYRNRIEGPTGIGYAETRDFYLLDRLRVH